MTTYCEKSRGLVPGRVGGGGGAMTAAPSFDPPTRQPPREKPRGHAFRPERPAPGQRPLHEPEMAAPVGERRRDVRVGGDGGLRDRPRRRKGIVAGLDEKRRRPDVGEVAARVGGRKGGAGSRSPRPAWASCGVNCGGRSRESSKHGRLQSDRARGIRSQLIFWTGKITTWNPKIDGKTQNAISDFSPATSPPAPLQAGRRRRRPDGTGPA